MHAEIIRLGESTGLDNPARVGHIAFDRAGVTTASFEGAPVEPDVGHVRWRELPSRGAAPDGRLRRG